MATLWTPGVHWKRYCRICRRLMAQCACEAAVKETRFGVCDHCASRIVADVKRIKQTAEGQK